MSFSIERLGEVVSSLQGTTQDLGQVATEEELEDADFLAALDEQVFLCDQCGWWCEASEMSEMDWICDECEER